MGNKPDAEMQDVILQFAKKYGLLGLMTALPTTPDFLEYEAVYLPKNHFIREETMATKQYMGLFFPFEKLDIIRGGVNNNWNTERDNTMMALMMTIPSF